MSDKPPGDAKGGMLTSEGVSLSVLTRRLAGGVLTSGARRA